MTVIDSYRLKKIFLNIERSPTTQLIYTRTNEELDTGGGDKIGGKHLTGRDKNRLQSKTGSGKELTI